MKNPESWIVGQTRGNEGKLSMSKDGRSSEALPLWFVVLRTGRSASSPLAGAL